MPKALETPTLQALHDPRSAIALTPRQWNLLIRQARHGGILARLTYRLKQNDLLDHIPPKARDQLTAATILAGQHERIIKWEAHCIRKALAQTGVTTILLKGAAYVAAGLSPGQGRLSSDVDILVPKKRLNDVEQALLDHGWEHMNLEVYDQRYYRTWMHELPPLQHNSRLSVIDVHHTILPESGRLHPDPAKLIAAARPLDGQRIAVLSPTDMVLHCAAHLFQDGDLSGGLKELMDLDELTRHFAATEPDFWDRLVPRAVEMDLHRPLFYALRYTAALLHTPIPKPTIDALSAAGSPPWPILNIMDALANRALLPEDEEISVPGSPTARFLLYLRSHWLRMPPLLLAKHLSHKALRRWKEKDKESTPQDGL